MGVGTEARALEEKGRVARWVGCSGWRARRGEISLSSPILKQKAKGEGGGAKKKKETIKKIKK